MVTEHNRKSLSFNENDMLIVLAVWLNSEDKGIISNVGLIGKQISIAPKNLTAHLKKLKEMKVLKIKNSGQGRKKAIFLNLEDQAISALVMGLVDFFVLSKEKFSEEINRIKREQPKGGNN